MLDMLGKPRLASRIVYTQIPENTEQKSQCSLSDSSCGIGMECGTGALPTRTYFDRLSSVRPPRGPANDQVAGIPGRKVGL